MSASTSQRQALTERVAEAFERMPKKGSILIEGSDKTLNVQRSKFEIHGDEVAVVYDATISGPGQVPKVAVIAMHAKQFARSAETAKGARQLLAWLLEAAMHDAQEHLEIPDTIGLRPDPVKPKRGQRGGRA